jgi:cation diffusion facilitator family transporter
VSASGGKKAIVAALLANLGIAISKFVAFLITGSSSMLAESVHSVADTGNQGLLLLGDKRAKREADADHPFGYGNDRYFYAFVVALVLFSLGSLFALYEGYEKISYPHPLDSPIVAIAVLVVAIGLEGFSLRTAVTESNPARGNLTWWEFIRRSKSPELPVVLLEDTAALLGLIFALGGIGLAIGFDEPRFDGVGTLAIGVLLGAVAVILAVEMKSLLIGEGASRSQVAAISTALVDGAEVTRLIHLRTMHLGPDELLVAAKIGLRPELDLPAVAQAIDAAERRVRAAVSIADLIYLEPDLYRESRDGSGGPGAIRLPGASALE